jgi:hypothetical protein
VGRAVSAASTVDDLLASLVGVWHPKYGLISMTGFVLSEPRVIVVDGCMSDRKITGFEIDEIVTYRGQHLPTRPIRLVPGDRFGPLLLEVPPELEVPGLRVDATPVKAGLAVQVGVAVRHETGFPLRRRGKTPRKEKVAFGLSNGRVIDGVEHAMKLSGFHCGHAVALACAVAPGASGAPVVDAQMAVRGFIIGGSADFKNPLSYMFPASRWGRFLL